MVQKSITGNFLASGFWRGIGHTLAEDEHRCHASASDDAGPHWDLRGVGGTLMLIPEKS